MGSRTITTRGRKANKARVAQWCRAIPRSGRDMGSSPTWVSVCGASSRLPSSESSQRHKRNYHSHNFLDSTLLECIAKIYNYIVGFGV